MSSKYANLSKCALFAAITCVLSPFSIPTSFGVSFTLQTLFILLNGIILGAKLGFYSTLIYVIIGLLGFPVFSNFRGGLLILLGPTGGFLISFPIMSFISGYFYCDIAKKNNFQILLGLLGCTIATIINFYFGLLFYMFVTKLDFITSFANTVAPFILSSIVKIFLAVFLGNLCKKYILKKYL